MTDKWMDAIFNGLVCAVTSAMVGFSGAVNSHFICNSGVAKAIPVIGVLTNVIAMVVFWGNITY